MSKWISRGLFTLLYGIIFLYNYKSFVAAEEEEEKYDLEIKVEEVEEGENKLSINEEELKDECDIEKCENDTVITVSPKGNGTFASKYIKINFKGKETKIKFGENSNINFITFSNISNYIHFYNYNKKEGEEVVYGTLTGTVTVNGNIINFDDKINITRIQIGDYENNDRIYIYDYNNNTKLCTNLTGTVTINKFSIKLGEVAESNIKTIEILNGIIYLYDDSGGEDNKYLPLKGKVTIRDKKIEFGDGANINRIDFDRDDICIYNNNDSLTGTVTVAGKKIEFCEGCEADTISVESIGNIEQKNLYIYKYIYKKNGNNNTKLSFNGNVKICGTEYKCRENKYITVDLNSGVVYGYEVSKKQGINSVEVKEFKSVLKKSPSFTITNKIDNMLETCGGEKGKDPENNLDCCFKRLCYCFICCC